MSDTRGEQVRNLPIVRIDVLEAGFESVVAGDPRQVAVSLDHGMKP